MQTGELAGSAGSYCQGVEPLYVSAVTRLMMQVNVTEAGVSGKGTSVRRREFGFGKVEGICREEKFKTEDYYLFTSLFPRLYGSVVGPIGKSPRSI